jgi:hypothetical protein
LQSAYHQLARLRDCFHSFPKLQLYGLVHSWRPFLADLHSQVQQLTRQHFLAYLAVLEAKYVYTPPTPPPPHPHPTCTWCFIFHDRAMDAPTRYAIERLSRDRLENRHDRYATNCTYSYLLTSVVLLLPLC